MVAGFVAPFEDRVEGLLALAGSFPLWWELEIIVGTGLSRSRYVTHYGGQASDSGS